MENKLIEIKEYSPTAFDRDYIDESTGTMIYERCGDQISIDFPSPKTKGRWVLTSTGWVGIIKLNENISILMNPKIEIDNLFAMWEYAYKLRSFKILEGLIGCSTVEDFYNQLAGILARKAFERSRKGLYKTYEDRCHRLPYVSGAMVVNDLINRPWDVNILCEYQENTVNNIDNQILLWTLYTILKSGNLNEHTKPIVHKSYMALQGSVDVVQHSFRECSNRSYNSLNIDYRLMHSICRFFLENKGPSSRYGEVSTIPFMVNMGRLFELFVSEWLKSHLSKGLEIRAQENIVIGDENRIDYNIDIVIYDSTNGRVKCVIDTKYKDVKKPSNSDINQIVAYSVTKNCRIGILLYPREMDVHIHYTIGDKDVYAMAFDIQKDIEEGGQVFLKELLKVLEG